MSKLLREATRFSSVWRAKNLKPKGKCLAAIRFMVGVVGLRLPWRPWPLNTALANFRLLAKNPAKYGWEKGMRLPGGALPEYCLIYFGLCGKLKDGRTAGHVAIYYRNQLGDWITGNETYEFTQGWADKTLGVFVPANE